jgi:RNA polymerase sigma factor (sigma-70 family)
MDFNSKKSWIEFYRKDSEQAWEFFVNHYHQLIMGVIHKLVNDYDESMEIYTYAIEQLKSDSCKKLISYFTKSRTYNFETWIAVVTRNCCFDWFRKEKGRKRLLKCIEDLPESDQSIFRYTYWYGYSYDETFNLLKTKHGYNKSFEEMIFQIDKIDEILQQKVRWNLTREWRSVLSTKTIEYIETVKENIKNCDPSPEEQFIQENSAQILKEIINNLSPEQQLIIQLHYYHGFTLNKIARILKMKNLWRVRRKLQNALKVLKKNLQQKGFSPSDLDLL